MPEIEKSFVFLQESIPQWLQDISRVEDKVAAMQAGLASISSAVSPPAQRRTESMESLRPHKLDAIAEDDAPSQGAQTDAVRARKRKTPSLLSGHASGPARFRRAMVITSYDGDMQRSLELMVRAIGTGRNMLRKAKMEAKMQELVSLSESSDDDDDDDDDDAAMPAADFRPRMSSMRARAAARRGASRGPAAPVTLFDTVDKTLELSQSLCEKAAHLTLRDGDCRKELEGIRRSFVDVLQTATTEAARCAASRSVAPPDLLSHDTSDTSVSSVEQPAYKRDFPRVTAPLPASPLDSKYSLPSSSAAGPTPTKPVIIEVDDDDDEDEEEFAMPAARLTSRHRIRV